jgi:hypothetical protein
MLLAQTLLPIAVYQLASFWCEIGEGRLGIASLLL